MLHLLLILLQLLVLLTLLLDLLLLLLLILHRKEHGRIERVRGIVSIPIRIEEKKSNHLLKCGHLCHERLNARFERRNVLLILQKKKMNKTLT